MTEVLVINSALIIRVCLVGSIFVVLPRISRKGLLFGTYIGERAAGEDDARRLLSRWSFACAMLMVLSLLVGLGISVAGWPLPGNYTGTGVLLLGGVVLYLRFHAWAKGFASPTASEQASKAVAVLSASAPQGVGFARLALVICIPMSLATYVYALFRQEAITDVSFAAIMCIPSMNLVTSPLLAVLALLTATAKRSLRGGSGGRSVEAQDAFRATNTRILTWMALLTCGFMSLLTVQIIRFKLQEIGSPGIQILVAGGLVIAFMLGSLVRIIRCYGQGGSRLEEGTVEAPLTNGLADNFHWVWGLFYFDRNDPSVLVESRFGIGYTFNYGNRTAILITVGFVVLSLALIALAVFKTFSG